MKPFFIAVVVVLCVAAAAARQQPVELQLKAAMNRELVDGDLAGAIQQYRDIIAKHPNNRDISARALLQLAGCYEKLGNRDARQAYERIVREYADVAMVAATAKARLASLQAESTAPFRARALAAELQFGSPDGRLAIYYKGDVMGRVFVRDLAGGTERLLIDLEGTASNFAWSPDSRFLAFDYQHAPTKTRETRVVSVASGQTRTLPGRHGYPFGWTAGGDLLFYRPNYPANAIDYTLANSQDGAVRRQFSQPITDGCCPLVTADGRSLVAPRAKRLVIVDLETGAERPLTVGSAEETRPVLSADGRLVAFASNRDGQWGLYVAPIGSAPVASPVRITYIDQASLNRQRGSYYDWWTGDGLLTMVMGGSESNVFRISVDRTTGRATGAPERLTQDAPRNFGAAISPDGARIAYQYQNGAKAGLAVMDATGVAERPLVELGGNLPVAWRNADEILYYDFETQAGQKPSIAAVNVRTGAKTAIARVEGLYWSYIAARNEILHSHPGGGGARAGTRLRAWSIADKSDRDVATIDNLVPFVSVSPDGRAVAYAVARNVDTSRVVCDVAVMSITGEAVRTLTRDAQQCDRPAAWSPDGRLLLVNTPKGPHVMAVETADSWPLHAAMTGAAWEATSWSPDGSFITATHATSRRERLAWEGITYDAVIRLMNRPSAR